MSLVLDASATLAWVFGEDAGPGLRQVFEHVAVMARWCRDYGGWKWPTA